MKHPIVAFSTPYEEFGQNRIFDEDYAARFPGARAMAILARRLGDDGVDIVTGDVAAARVCGGELDPRDIALIQEADAAEGLWLLERGATPRVLVCMESPGYAWKFYDLLPALAPRFETRILFSGAFDLFHAEHGANVTAHFPSLPKSPPPAASPPWSERLLMVAVVGNKSFLLPPFRFTPRGICRVGKSFLVGRAIRSSATFRMARQGELITARLNAIRHFCRTPDFQLFGTGWEDLSRLPASCSATLKKAFARHAPCRCENKIATLGNFKFCLCYENCRFPGYVTEKIFDCFVAGTIPVYCGAPDIAAFCPPATFVDVRQFANLADLEIFLRTMSPSTAMEMLAAGQRFLASPKGMCFTHEAMAETLASCVS